MVTGILVTSGHQHAVEGGKGVRTLNQLLQKFTTLKTVQIYFTGSWQFPSKVSTLSTVVHKDRPVLWISLLKKAGSSHSQVHSMYYVYLPTFPP